MAMAAPSAQAQTERRKPAAAMTSGRVMKGPTPIISSMLKSTAERRPMRRSRWDGLPDWGEGTEIKRARCTDCTLAMTMILAKRLHCAALPLALATVVIATANPRVLAGQEKSAAALELPAEEPSSIALPLALDRGQAAVEQALKRLHTTASVMMIVAHPDDEDGAL